MQVKREDIEALIPKGASELTKQQLRYLLQVTPRSDWDKNSALAFQPHQPTSPHLLLTHTGSNATDT